MKSKQDIYFYLHKRHWPTDESEKNLDNPALFFLSTPRCWILQTYLHLSKTYMSAKLVDTVPYEGIIVYFVGDLELDLKPNKKQLFVAISADSNASTYSQIRVVQNRQQARHLSDSYFIKHWPQPGLRPRDNSRNDMFQNIAFFGDDVNLDSYLKSKKWLDELKTIGLYWCLRNSCNPELANYSDVDAIVAVRSFKKKGFIRKPASKLYNAWIAGIPALLGREYAFQEEKKTELDFIEVKNPNEILTALRKLKLNPQYRNSIIKNGKERKSEVTQDALLQQWIKLLSETASSHFLKWCNLSNEKRNLFFAQRLIQKKLRGLQYRLFALFGNQHNCI